MLTIHRDEDRNPTWAEVRRGQYHAGFQLEDSGELIETVDFEPHGLPDFSEGAVCEEHRASDPDLVTYLRKERRHGS
jgi:hypothetical protein